MHTKQISDRELVIGAKLSAIIQNPDSRTKFAESPKSALEALGVASDVTVLADTADMVHLIIPVQVDAKRTSDNDESYFEELGRLALGNCMYEEKLD